MATFLQLYGELLDTELGSTDRDQRFTTALRKAWINDGQRTFNEQTDCFTKRAPIALTDGTAEYDLEAIGVIAAQDFLWASETSASLKCYDGAGSEVTDYRYLEGPDLPFIAEEALNQTRRGWRAEPASTPTAWTIREEGGSTYAVLVPAPDIPTAETWTLLLPYVAQPADMSADADEPYSVSGNPKTRLKPYHKALVYWAAAQGEKRRKNVEGEERQLKRFAAIVSKYTADQQPKNGGMIRVSQDYRRRLRATRPLDPTRYQN